MKPSAVTLIGSVVTLLIGLIMTVAGVLEISIEDNLAIGVVLSASGLATVGVAAHFYPRRNHW